MNHENWDEKKIEQLLSNAPKIIDQRSKDEIFQRLKEEGLFDDKPSKKVVAKSNKWLPYFISIAAVLICVILLPSILNKVENEEKVATDSTNSEIDNLKQTENVELANLSETSLKTAFYEDDLEENSFLKIGLVSEAADSIPITISIPKDKIAKDFGSMNPSILQIYNEYAPKIDEEKLGFIDYHPILGKFSEQDEKLILYLASNQNYDTASAAFTTFEASLVDTFSSYYSEIEFRDEEGASFVFQEIGEAKPLNLTSEYTKYNYFRYTQKDGSQYLVPNFRASFKTVDEALDAMRVETNDIYESVILEDLDYSCHDNGNTVVVKFHSEVDLMKYNQTEAMQMIEGMLLTAASFNKQVQFENVSPKSWQGFDFSKPLPKPIGPNKISLSALIQ